MIVERRAMIFAGQKQFADVFSGMNATFKPTVHASPKLNDLRAQVGPYNVFDLTRSVQRIYVLVHMIRHVAPKRECSRRQFQVDSVFFAIANECSKLTARHMIMKDEKKSFVELKIARPLLHQLPGAVEELRENGRNLKAITNIKADNF